MATMATAASSRAALPAWDAAAFCRECSVGNLARVRELTSAEHMAAHSGVDLNTRAFLNATGLWHACVNGRSEVVRHLTSPAMLAAGIDVNKGGSYGISPLATAAYNGHVEVVRHLLESPDLAAAGITVDVNAADKFGRTALHMAAATATTGSLEVVSLLLRQPQLDMDARDKDGKTALQVADSNTKPDGHGAEKAALIREAMQRRMARLYVLVVAMWSRREGRVAPVSGAGAGAGAGVGAAPALPAGTLDEEDEEARARRRLMGSLPPHLLRTVCALASGGV